MIRYRVRLRLTRKTAFISGYLTRKLAKARADFERPRLGTGETATVERYDTKTRRIVSAFASSRSSQPKPLHKPV